MLEDQLKRKDTYILELEQELRFKQNDLEAVKFEHEQDK